MVIQAQDARTLVRRRGHYGCWPGGSKEKSASREIFSVRASSVRETHCIGRLRLECNAPLQVVRWVFASSAANGIVCNFTEPLWSYFVEELPGLHQVRRRCPERGVCYFYYDCVCCLLLEGR